MKNLDIKNFQKHKSLTVDFSRLTVITGPSSRGKSAVLKAIKAVLLNDFPVNSIRDGAKSSTIKLDDIVRHRSRSSTGHYLIGGIKYMKLGKQLPPELPKMTELNFIDQFNPHYFLSLSPSDRAKLLYNLIGLSNINSILDKAKAELNEVNAEIRFKQKSLDRLRAKLLAIPEKLPELQRRLEELEAKISLLQKLSEIKLPRVPTLKLPDMSINLQLELLQKLSEIKLPRVPTLKLPDMSINLQLELLRKLSEIKLPRVPTLKLPDMSINLQLELLRKLSEIKLPRVPLQTLLALDIRRKMLILLEASRKESELLANLKEFEICPLCRRPL